MKPLFIFLFTGLLLACHPGQPRVNQVSNQQTATADESGLNRHPQNIHYSRHAKCRMECRHINETEIRQVLETGTVNYRKSELGGDACHQKFAVEGNVQNDHLRVIFAPCGSTVTVVTCIDLDREWSCDCPGDNH